MKSKYFLVLFLLMTFSFSMVSAWSYSNHNSYGDAFARVTIHGTEPRCDGTTYNNHYIAGNVYSKVCVGNGWYFNADLEHGDKMFVAYKLANWPSADFRGYPGLPLITNGKQYITNDPSGEIHKYIICGHDYDEAANGNWAWAGKCGGYIGNSNWGGSYNAVCVSNNDCGTGQICEKGNSLAESRCVADPCYQVSCGDTCEAKLFATSGSCSLGVCSYSSKTKTIGQCGVECLQDSDCGETEVATSCSDKNLKTDTTVNTCQNNICVAMTTSEVERLSSECPFETYQIVLIGVYTVVGGVLIGGGIWLFRRFRKGGKKK